MNIDYRKPLPNAGIDFFDTREAVDAIEPGAYAKLPYTSRVLAENLVRKCAPEMLTDSLKQLIYRKRDLDFPWFPARVVCHDILGQTALVDLAGLRDAIAAKGGDPAKVNPVVPTQLIVDHSLAVEHAGFEKDAFEKNRAIEDRRNDDRFHFINWTKTAFKNVDVIPPGNGIMHQINLERMSPVIQARDGVAFPDTLVGTDSHTPHVDALGVIAVGVGGLEADLDARRPPVRRDERSLKRNDASQKLKVPRRDPVSPHEEVARADLRRGKDDELRVRIHDARGARAAATRRPRTHRRDAFPDVFPSRPISLFLGVCICFHVSIFGKSAR